MTLHLNTSENISQKTLSFLKSLSKQGEPIEIINDFLYKYERNGISKGLQQLENGEFISTEEILKRLSK